MTPDPVTAARPATVKGAKIMDEATRRKAVARYRSTPRDRVLVALANGLLRLTTAGYRDRLEAILRTGLRDLTLVPRAAVSSRLLRDQCPNQPCSDARPCDPCLSYPEG